MLRSLLFAAAGALAVGCASPGENGRPSGPPLRIGLHDYRSERTFELVNESHTTRLEQYGEVRDTVGRKVQTDAITAELFEWIEDQGFDRLAQSGTAPRSAGEGTFWSLELESPDGVRYVVYQKGTPAAEAQELRTIKNGFLDIYNRTYALQAVDVREGEEPFETPKAPRRKP